LQVNSAQYPIDTIDVTHGTVITMVVNYVFLIIAQRVTDSFLVAREPTIWQEWFHRQRLHPSRRK
jgi:hypothetical protein